MITTETSWGEIDSQVSKQREGFPRMSDFVEVYSKKNYEKGPARIRFLGPTVSVCNHSVNVKRIKREGDAGAGNLSDSYWFMPPCTNWNPQTMRFEDNGCPFCKAEVPTSIKFYQNAIVRELEDLEPARKGERVDSEKVPVQFGENKFFLKRDKETEAWTPVRVIEIPKALTSKLHNIESTNFYMDGNGKRATAKLNDLQYGVDLFLFYHPDKGPAEKYDLQRDVDSGKTPVDKEYRKNLLLWNILCMPEVDKEKVEASFRPIASRILNAKNTDFIRTYSKQVAANEKAAVKESLANTKIISLDMEEEEETPAPAKVVESKPAVVESKPIISVDDDDDMFEDLD